MYCHSIPRACLANVLVLIVHAARCNSKHQFAGWGWQQDENASPNLDNGHYYNEETALAQAAVPDPP